MGSIVHEMIGAALGMANDILGTLAPVECVMCSRRIAHAKSRICPACSLMLPFTTEPLTPYDNPTIRKTWGKTSIEKCAAAFVNKPGSFVSRLIHQLKYRGDVDFCEWLGEELGGWLMSYGFLDDIDIVIPLPLHPIRERERGYNQSMLLARGIARSARLPLGADAVARIRNTASQATLTPDKRMRNVEGAFHVARPLRIEGRHVLLVDDVITSGASVVSCAEEMLKAEGTRVSVFTVGRNDS